MNFDSVSTEFTERLWTASWTGGLFVLAVWIVCRLAGKMPAWARYWLWWVAAAQLTLRVVLPGTISLPILPNPAQTDSISSGASVVVNLFPAARIAPVETENPAVRSAQVTTDLHPLPVSRGSQSGIQSPSDLLIPAEAVSHAPVGIEAPQSSGSKLPEIAFALWLGGLCVCIVFTVRKMVRTRRLIHTCTPVDCEWLTEFRDELGQGRGRVGVYESEQAPCPLLTGWIRPRIVFPTGSMDSMPREDVRMAVAHELAHRNRKDLWLGTIPTAATSLFFFHPLAWLATREAEMAAEEACDVDALIATGHSPASYARFLIHSAQAHETVAALGASFRFGLLHRRISMLTTTRIDGVARYRTLCLATIVMGGLLALPWSVTAQSSPKSASAHSPSRVRHTHRLVRKRHRVAARSSTIKVVKIVKNGKLSIRVLQIPADPTHSAPVVLPVTAIPAGARASAPLHAPVAPPALFGSVLAGTSPRAVAIGSLAPPAGAGGVVIASPSRASGAPMRPSTPPSAAGTADPALFGAAPSSSDPFHVGPSAAISGSTPVPSAAFQGGVVATENGQALAPGTAGGGFGASASGPFVTRGSGGGFAPSAAQSMAPATSGSANLSASPYAPQTTSGGKGTDPLTFGQAVAPATTGIVGRRLGEAWAQGNGFGGGRFFGDPTQSSSIAREEVSRASGNKVSLHVKKASLHDVLSKMFEAVDVDYSIRSDVSSDVVTCSLRGAPLETALQTVLASVKQPLTYRRDENGVYSVFPKGR